MNLVDSTLENLTKCILYFDRVSSLYFLIKLNYTRFSNLESIFPVLSTV